MSSATDNKKKRSRSMRKSKEDISGVNFKDAKDLQEDYEILQRTILNEELEVFSEIIRSSDMKYFLVHNDLDYSLFRDCVRFQRVEFIT